MTIEEDYPTSRVTERPHTKREARDWRRSNQPPITPLILLVLLISMAYFVLRFTN
jgi:hypothetical protein